MLHWCWVEGKIYRDSRCFWPPNQNPRFFVFRWIHPWGRSEVVTVSETNSAPENWLLEDYLSLLRRPFFRGHVGFREGISALGWLGIWRKRTNMSQGPRWFVICSQVVVPAAASGKWWTRLWWAGHFEIDLWKMKRNRGSIPTWGYVTVKLCFCFFLTSQATAQIGDTTVFPARAPVVDKWWSSTRPYHLDHPKITRSRRNLDRHWTVVPCGLHWASTSVIVSG